MAVGGVWVPCDAEEKPPCDTHKTRSDAVPLWLDGRVVVGGYWSVEDCCGWEVDDEDVLPSHWLKVIPPA